MRCGGPCPRKEDEHRSRTPAEACPGSVGVTGLSLFMASETSSSWKSRRLVATGQAGPYCSTAHYRRDDRALAARELQLIREARRRLRALMECRGARAGTAIQPGSRSVCLRLRSRLRIGV
jgi:hypothetical protein